MHIATRLISKIPTEKRCGNKIGDYNNQALGRRRRRGKQAYVCVLEIDNIKKKKKLTYILNERKIDIHF